MHRLLLAASLLTMIGTALAADQKSACILAAFTAYNNANVGLMASAGISMSVEAQIAQRRLQEQYCVRVAQCEDETLPSQQTTLVFDTAFSKCLREEAIEKYQLTPSD